MKSHMGARRKLRARLFAGLKTRATYFVEVEAPAHLDLCCPTGYRAVLQLFCSSGGMLCLLHSHATKLGDTAEELNNITGDIHVTKVNRIPSQDVKFVNHLTTITLEQYEPERKINRGLNKSA